MNALLACACLVGASAALAQASAQEPAQKQAASSDDLSAQATDPTASLMSFQLLNWYTPRYHSTDDSSNQIVFRAAIPFDLFGKPNIFRVTQGSYTSSPSGATGLGDMQVFNLTVFGAPWGRWGLGLAGSLPTGRDGLSSEQWALGPAAGFVNSSSRAYNFGLFAQTFFSVAGDEARPDVGVVNLQPIFSWQLGGGRSLSLGNSAFIYDTTKSRWASLALGVNYGQVISLWGQKWRPNVEINHDFQDRTGTPKLTLRAGVSLLLPSL